MAHRPAPLAGPLGRWYDAADGGRGTLVLLVLFVAAWTLFNGIAFAPLGPHADVSEAYVWALHPALGYDKHPPLTGWLATPWFAVMPAADWSMHLFAMVNAALGLFFADLIARRFVTGDKRLVVLLLLLLLPFYQFRAYRYNANAVLLSIWPLATYCFLRAFETRAVLWSILAGVTAALAMLGKYYSVYLIAGFIVAALAHPSRRHYIASASPWISVAAGLVALGPHFAWMAGHDFSTIRFAMTQHSAASLLEVAFSPFVYLAGCIAYALLPAAVFWLAARPDPETWRDIAWPRDAQRRMLVVLFASTMLLPAITAPFLGVVLTPLWSLAGWFLLPVVLLSSPLVALSRKAATWIAVLVAAITLIAIVVVAPVLARINFLDGHNGRTATRKLAEEVTFAWRDHVGQKLGIVTGDARLSAAVAFYSDDAPDATLGPREQHAPWITPERLRREGWAAICMADDTSCVEFESGRAASSPGVKRFTLTVVPRFLGENGTPWRFVIILVPPNGQASLPHRPPT